MLKFDQDNQKISQAKMLNGQRVKLF